MPATNILSIIRGWFCLARRRIGFTALLTALLLTPAHAFAQFGAPEKDLWGRWTKHLQSPIGKLNHDLYARFLSRNLVRGSDGVVRIRYGRVSAADKSALREYISRLQATDVDRMTRDQQMAFWINLYNAKTIDLVIEAYPVSSIRNVRSALTRGPWDDKVMKVNGVALSLNDIEHRILRPIWKDVRIHYAVNCASLGCPNIMNRPYTASNIDTMLNGAARDFINHSRAFKLENDDLVASSIFDWYQSDWGSEAAVLRHARKYASARTQKVLQGRTRIDSYEYDWSLNGAR